MTVTYLDLDPDQRAGLDDLPFDGNHPISGPPGSGKSILAAQRAVMLALTGTPVVLLTYSNLLRQSLAGTVHALGPADRSVRVMTAHSWLAEWYGAAPPAGSDGWYDWDALLNRAAETAGGVGAALVVDEGQDLPPEFYLLVRMLEAHTTVYADECQRLTDTNSTLDEITRNLGKCTRHDLAGTTATPNRSRPSPRTSTPAPAPMPCRPAKAHRRACTASTSEASRTCSSCWPRRSPRRASG